MKEEKKKKDNKRLVKDEDRGSGKSGDKISKKRDINQISGGASEAPIPSKKLNLGQQTPPRTPTRAQQKQVKEQALKQKEELPKGETESETDPAINEDDDPDEYARSDQEDQSQCSERGLSPLEARSYDNTFWNTGGWLLYKVSARWPAVTEHCRTASQMEQAFEFAPLMRPEELALLALESFPCYHKFSEDPTAARSNVMIQVEAVMKGLPKLQEPLQRALLDQDAELDDNEWYFFWSMRLRVTYPLLKKFLRDALNFHTGSPAGGKVQASDPRSSTLFGQIVSWQAHEADREEGRHSRIPGVPLYKPLTLIAHIGNEGSSSPLAIFGSGRPLSVNVKAAEQSVEAACSQFRLACVQHKTEVLDTLKRLTEMALALFSFLYRHSDYGPNGNCQKSSRTGHLISSVPAQPLQAIFFMHLLIGLKSKINPIEIVTEIAQRSTESCTSHIMEVLEAKRGPKNPLLQLIHDHMIYRPMGSPSAWGSHTLPTQAVLGQGQTKGFSEQLMRFEVDLVAYATAQRIHGAFENFVRAFQRRDKKTSKKAPERIKTDQQSDASSVGLCTPSRPPASDHSTDQRAQWFKVLLDSVHGQVQFNITAASVLAKVPSFELAVRELLAGASWEGGALFYAHVSRKAAKTNASSLEAMKSPLYQGSSLMDWTPDPTCLDTAPGAPEFAAALRDFPFVPAFFLDPVIEWLSGSEHLVDEQTVCDFFRRAKAVRPGFAFPLKLIITCRLTKSTQAVTTILESQGIAAHLAPIITSKETILRNEDCAPLLRCIGDCAKLVQWVLQSTASVRESLRSTLASKANSLTIFMTHIGDCLAGFEDAEVERLQWAHHLQPLLQLHLAAKVNLPRLKSLPLDEWFEFIATASSALEHNEGHIQWCQQVVSRQLKSRSLDEDLGSAITKLRHDFFNYRSFAACMPSISADEPPMSPYAWQYEVAATNSHVARTIKGAQWCLNGIATGSGKSVVISLIAHYLSTDPQIDKVIILSPNVLLTSQLKSRYFSSAANSRANILHVAANSQEFLKMNFSMKEADFEKTILIVDEVDSFVQQDRLRTFYLRAPGTQEYATYCVDYLDVISRFRFVVGFCAFVDERTEAIIGERAKVMQAADGTPIKKVLTFNYGNFKGDSVDTIMEPNFHLRTGKNAVSMQKDTLALLQQVLDDLSPPKCVFVVHAHREQVEEIYREVKDHPESYRYGQRTLMLMVDTESPQALSEFIQHHAASIRGENGWVFFSHRGVARGLDINGPQAATMIINFRYANTTELTQTIGRGNRNPQARQSVRSHVLVDERPIGSLAEVKRKELDNIEAQKIQKFFTGTSGLTISSKSTQDELDHVALDTDSPAVTHFKMDNDLAEYIGQGDIKGFQFAVHALLTFMAAMEERYHHKGLAVELRDQYAREAVALKGTPSLPQRYKFPHVATREAPNHQCAFICDRIMLMAKLYGAGRVAMLLLKRAHQCGWQMWADFHYMGVQDLGIITKAFAILQAFIHTRQCTYEPKMMKHSTQPLYGIRAVSSADIVEVPDHHVYLAICEAAGVGTWTATGKVVQPILGADDEFDGMDAA